MYLIGINAETGKLIHDGAEPCMLCKRVTINAGIEKVITRNEQGKLEIFQVSDWIRDEKFEYRDLS